jgi:DnaA family protein
MNCTQMSGSQLVLGVDLHDQETFANFYAGSNAAIVESLKGCIAGRGERVLSLCGPRGAGKSHLLNAAARAAADDDATVLLLRPPAPDGGDDSIAPEILGDLSSVSCLLVDDLDRFAGDDDWERALFVAYVELERRGDPLIVASETPAARLPWRLADLGSRMAGALTMSARLLSDDDLPKALSMRARRVGIALPEAAMHLMMERCSRDIGSLLQVLRSVGDVSLEQQRRVTRRLVAEVLERSER